MPSGRSPRPTASSRTFPAPPSSTACTTHAAIALVGAQTEAQLTAALENRDVIGMAKGILMQRHDVDSVAAFRMLVEGSQNANLKLHEVAAWLVENRREL